MNRLRSLNIPHRSGLTGSNIDYTRVNNSMGVCSYRSITSDGVVWYSTVKNGVTGTSQKWIIFQLLYKTKRFSSYTNTNDCWLLKKDTSYYDSERPQDKLGHFPTCRIASKNSRFFFFFYISVRAFSSLKVNKTKIHLWHHWHWGLLPKNSHHSQ